MGHFSPFTVVKKLSGCFGRLKSIPYDDPGVTPGSWCEIQPCKTVRIGSQEITLTQPTSTFLVYALGVVTLLLGFYFLSIRGDEMSRVWWGVSLLLWGIGALLAGTSYQAFAYEIKCAGREWCSWTSWWEVIYLMFQQVSMNAMLVAVAYSCTEGFLQVSLLAFAMISSIIYVTFTFLGGMYPMKSLITFNVMVCASVPILVIVVALNSWRYWIYRDPMDLSFLITWLLLLLTSALYWLYDELDITTKLWTRGRGIWFSQNDVLHVCLILWVIYIFAAVANQVRDYTPLVLPG